MMRKIILLFMTLFILACSSPEYICFNTIEGNSNNTLCCYDKNNNNRCDEKEESSFRAEALEITPRQQQVIDCSKFFIEAEACYDDHTTIYSIKGNAPFSYELVGLGAKPFQGEFEEVMTEHTGKIQTDQRLQQIVINPYLNGVMCKEASVQVMLEEC